MLAMVHAQLHARMGVLGWGGGARRGVAQLEEAAGMASAALMWLAQLGEAHALAGNEARARAMDYLERAVAERAGPSYSIKGSLRFAPLRGHPQFIALLRTMKLA